MGKPTNEEDFEAFAIEEIRLFVDKEVLKNYVKKNKLVIAFEGYGQHELEIMEE
ncbi:MAG: hypothetical protein ACOYVK_19055 [Bacillota bacterium]